MKIIIDERESDLYNKCATILSNAEKTTNIQLEKMVLPLGDIIIRTNDDKDIVIIERKAFYDLFASIKDGRYEEQSYRLIHSSGLPPHCIIYLLEGLTSQIRSPIEKKLLYSSMTSLNYFKGFSIMRTFGMQETAELVIYMAGKLEKDLAKGKTAAYSVGGMARIDPSEPIQGEEMQNLPKSPENYCTVVKKVKKDNITPSNIGEIILCQIPGISHATAIAIMKEFTHFPEFMDRLKSQPELLDNIYMEANGKKRKINKTSIESIKQFLLCPTNIVEP